MMKRPCQWRKYAIAKMVEPKVIKIKIKAPCSVQALDGAQDEASSRFPRRMMLSVYTLGGDNENLSTGVDPQQLRSTIVPPFGAWLQRMRCLRTHAYVYI